MANSRSNIYPVQLQGAELNLNKLDAEIKQYSGFNKNNAPFVGGCLSNIFTKDETIEGATSKNTYIAPNGDVYRVTTEGLFKNDEKLIDTSDADFFDVVDLGADIFPESTVYVYDEETYIYIKDNKYYYHSGKVDHDFLNPYGASIDIVNTKAIDFKILKKTISGILYDIVGIYINSSSNNRIFLSIYEKNENGTLEAVYTHLEDNLDTSLISLNLKFINLIVKTNGSTYDDFKIALITVCPTVETKHNNVLLSFDGTAINFESIINYYSSSGGVFRGTLARNFIFTDKYAFYTNILDATTNNLPKNFKQEYIIDFENSALRLTQSIGDRYNVNKKFKVYDGAIIKQWGYKNIIAHNNSGVNLIAIDDYVTTNGYITESNVSSYDYFLGLDIGCIINECVLINGTYASGLSLPGGIQLVTEWNSVDIDYIFFGDNTEDWKESNYVYIWKNINTGKWAKLIKSNPKIKNINGQVVINSNSVFNSIRISDGKKLLFAPAWNNRHLNIYNDTFGFSTIPNYNATSINEYSLENNTSIIINSVNNQCPIVVNTFNGRNFIDSNYVFVNFYSGQSAITYKYSFVYNDFDNIYYINNLISLPFPTNTDGNVQYSPSLFATEKGKYGNLVFISEGGTAYKLMTYDNKAVMSYFLSTAVEGLQDFFTIQGQLYGILENQIYNFSIVNEIANRGDFIVSVEGLQFCGNTPYEALFFSKTNRCLYSFTGANVLNAKQFVDKISEVRNYKYNPATQSIFLITDIGVIVYSLFGIYQIEFLNCQDMYLLNNGVILTDNEGTFKYVKYYKEETTDDYTKENIQLETMFYGMNNQTVTINDCLYMRIFSEEHEEGNLEVSATTLSLEGRTTETTTFRINASDWDAITHTIYLRYQPQNQRGLGISFSINSPFKIASLSVGSQADAILIDKVSKGAINAPQRISNNVEW